MPVTAYEVLEGAASRHPDDQSILALLARDREDGPAAKVFAKRALALDPDNPQMPALLRSLGRQ
ncbi:MAG TPA: hypothetical protein VNR39_09090 [Pseudolabrys sp.]|nr:hypothetical protein [Pseudolabrys sp.]